MLAKAVNKIKIVVINVFHICKSLSRNMKDVKKKTQIKLLELKTTVSEMQNTVYILHSISDIVEEKISELEDITGKMVQAFNYKMNKA